ncbi:hypothetical protein [Antiquaquibacter soli]|uniref:DUF4044 domain-containing protein n=1 Tax=Antiquaquibacter soli TaxID=3064523 RepID=A0ABT9BNT0_9MICO|nr:hypothetical protein [Protaetiibacter sp. WY-16]MDO7882678.1 hypothetical protein [Protaetiibacter sp. WY-16]
MSYDDDDDRPVTFLGRLRNQKAIVWVLIIGLVVLAVGAGTIVALVSALNPF